MASERGRWNSSLSPVPAFLCAGLPSGGGGGGLASGLDLPGLLPAPLSRDGGRGTVCLTRLMRRHGWGRGGPSPSPISGVSDSAEVFSGGRAWGVEGQN